MRLIAFTLIVLTAATCASPPAVRVATCNWSCAAPAVAKAVTSVDNSARWCELDGVIHGPFRLSDPLGPAHAIRGWATRGSPDGTWVVDNGIVPLAIMEWREGERDGRWFRRTEAGEFETATYKDNVLVSGSELGLPMRLPERLDAQFLVELLGNGEAIPVAGCDGASP